MTGVMMPVIGGMLSKNYISPIWYAAVGFLLFFGFCFDLSAISLDAGALQISRIMSGQKK